MRSLDDVSFEAWLCGANKQVQKKYWNAIRKTGWNKYRIPASIEGIDSIVEMPLIDRPNFDDPDYLTGQLEQGVMEFIENVSEFLSENGVVGSY